MKIHFETPIFFLIFLISIAIMIFTIKRAKSYAGSISFPFGKELYFISQKRNFPLYLPDLILSLSLISISLALTRPTVIKHISIASREGIAIFLVMDVSGSMLAEDFQPSNRINVARRVLSDFVSMRKTDRIGLITFAGLPFLRCPLTTDYRTLLRLINDIKAVRKQEYDGTAIGDALVLAKKRIENAIEKSKIIVLVTDGENNKGQFEPLLAAKMLKEKNIKVYTVGIGTKGLVPYPVIDQNGFKTYRFVQIGFNEDVLQKIASETKGKYYSVQDKEALQKVFMEIDALEKSRSETPTYEVKKEIFMYPLFMGIIFIFLYLFLEFLIFRVLK